MSMTTTEEALLASHGPLISFNQLARLLDRTPEGLRSSLRSSGDEWSAIKEAKRKIGRRIYFKTVEVAQFLEG